MSFCKRQAIKVMKIRGTDLL